MSFQPPISRGIASTLTPRQLWAFGLAIVTTIVVILGSLGNSLQLQASWLEFEYADKVKHFGAYAILAVLWLYAFRQNGTCPYRRLWLALFGLGAGLEVMQWAFYPDRFFEFADMLANALGALAGTLGFLIITRTFPPQKFSSWK